MSRAKSRTAERRREVDLSVRLGPVTLENPVLTASGTFGYGDEYAHVVPPSELGAVITNMRLAATQFGLQATGRAFPASEPPGTVALLRFEAGSVAALLRQVFLPRGAMPATFPNSR